MKIIQLIIAVLIAQSAGIIGSLFTAPAIPTWYAQLDKPDFTPPGWVFGPVWTMLYTLMGIASLWVWQKRNEHPTAVKALVVYAVHLVVNALWSFLFFGLKNPGLGFAGILALWAMIWMVIYLFYKVERWSAYLLLPYVLWVGFAGVLNYSIMRLN